MPHYPITGRAESTGESDRLRPLVLVALGAGNLTELGEQSGVALCPNQLGNWLRGAKLPAKHHAKIQTWVVIRPGTG